MRETIPFHPASGPDAGPEMPPSVPTGTVMELWRAPLLEAAEARFDDWMAMLHARYDECLESLTDEHMAFEATFISTEADGSRWMYHLQVRGAGSRGLDLTKGIDAAHEAWARSTKHRGWEVLEPRLFLCPPQVRDALCAAAGADLLPTGALPDSSHRGQPPSGERLFSGR